MISRRANLFFGGLVSCGLFAADSAHVRLLTTGAFHGSDVSAKSGERWTAVVPAGAGFRVRSVTISTRRVNDVVVDAPNEKTGIEISARGSAPLFLVRGVRLQNPVRTWFYAREPVAIPLDALHLRCEDGCGNYSVRVTSRVDGDYEHRKPSSLILTSPDGTTQVLHDWPEGLDDQHCELIWAGDVDGDGKLDLLMDVSDHYNLSELTLFLSSRAGAGKLVTPTAVFSTTGC